MSMPPPASPAQRTDGCAGLRADVARRCGEAHASKAAYGAQETRVRDLRRDLVSAQHQRSAAEAAADPGLRAEQKARAREAYERARLLADGDRTLAEATATWARAIDRINRASRSADRELSRTRKLESRAEELLRQAEREEQAGRIRAEQAEAACLDARVRLAACEETARPTPVELGRATLEPPAGTGAHAVAISPIERADPLVIEAIVSGDRQALELTAVRIAEHTGLAPAQAQVQLQELLDAIIEAASADGFLVFDVGHHFWSALSVEESRDVVAALARLGFQLEPAGGWYAGRAPMPMDLSMALAYAGLDARNMRDLPTGEELRVLPQSIAVDARAFLARHAPNLVVDNVVRALGRRAAQLEPLWDAWGQVRPILLSPRRTLGTIGG